MQVPHQLCPQRQTEASRLLVSRRRRRNPGRPGRPFVFGGLSRCWRDVEDGVIRANAGKCWTHLRSVYLVHICDAHHNLNSRDGMKHTSNAAVGEYDQQQQAAQHKRHLSPFCRPRSLGPRRRPFASARCTAPAARPQGHSAARCSRSSRGHT